MITIFEGSIDLFKNAGLTPSDYYYFSDVIVLPEYRGRGISRMLFAILEKQAQELGFKKTCFVTESHVQHPLKPGNYKELDTHWKSLGYQKSSLSLAFKWMTKQPDSSVVMNEHVLDYWLQK